MAMATSSTDEGDENAVCVDSRENGGGYMLVLTDKKVYVSRRGQEIRGVLLEDILGVETTPCRRTTSVELIVHGFPKTKKLFRGETRWRMKMIYCFDAENSTENERLAKEWKQKIVIQSRKAIQKKYNWYYDESKLL